MITGEDVGMDVSAAATAYLVLGLKQAVSPDDQQPGNDERVLAQQQDDDDISMIATAPCSAGTKSSRP